MKGLLLAMLVGFSCSRATLSQNARPEPVIAIDTSVVVLRVFNRQPASVRVYLHSQNQPRRRVSALPAGHDGYFVIPSGELRQTVFFYVTAESDDPTLRPYRSGLIWRNPSKITMVLVMLGPMPTSDSTRWGPQS